VRTRGSSKDFDKATTTHVPTEKPYKLAGTHGETRAQYPSPRCIREQHLLPKRDVNALVPEVALLARQESQCSHGHAGQKKTRLRAKHARNTRLHTHTHTYTREQSRYCTVRFKENTRDVREGSRARGESCVQRCTFVSVSDMFDPAPAYQVTSSLRIYPPVGFKPLKLSGLPVVRGGQWHPSRDKLST